MSQLYEIKLRIEAKIQEDKLDANEVKGKIGLRAGRLLAFITAETPDDPAVVVKLKQAAKDVLNIAL